MSPTVGPHLERVRRAQADLCRAVGVDPGRVIDVQWHSLRPATVRLVLLERDPVTGEHLAEDHPTPEGWAP